MYAHLAFSFGSLFSGKESRANVVRQNTFFLANTNKHILLLWLPFGSSENECKLRANTRNDSHNVSCSRRVYRLHSPEEEGNSGARHMIVGQHPLQVVHVVVVGEYALHLPKAWLKLCCCSNVLRRTDRRWEDSFAFAHGSFAAAGKQVNGRCRYVCVGCIALGKSPSNLLIVHKDWHWKAANRLLDWSNVREKCKNRTTRTNKTPTRREKMHWTTKQAAVTEANSGKVGNIVHVSQ